MRVVRRTKGFYVLYIACVPLSMQMTSLWNEDYQVRDYDDQSGCQLAETTCKRAVFMNCCVYFHEQLKIWTVMNRL